MKNLLTGILIITTLFLSSCQDNIITNSLPLEPYVVTDITEFSNKKVYARYFVDNNSDYVYYTDKISFIDSIGKYNIGDSVKAEFIKQ